MIASFGAQGWKDFYFPQYNLGEIINLSPAIYRSIKDPKIISFNVSCKTDEFLVSRLFSSVVVEMQAADYCSEEEKNAGRSGRCYYIDWNGSWQCPAEQEVPSDDYSSNTDDQW